MQISVDRVLLLHTYIMYHFKYFLTQTRKGYLSACVGERKSLSVTGWSELLFTVLIVEMIFEMM